MVKIFLLIFGFWFLVLNSDIHAEFLTIKKVTVYEDRAQIDSVVSLSLKKGVQSYKIEGLNPRLVTSSLRAYVQDQSNHLKVLSIESEVFRKMESPNKKIQELEENLNQVKKSLLVARLEIENTTVLIQSISQLLKLFQQAISESIMNPDAITQQWQDSFQFLVTHQESYQLKIQQAQLKIKDLEENQAELQKKLNQIKVPLRKNQCQATVVIESHENTKHELWISYIVYDAGWKPNYRIQVDSDQNMNVAYYGLIWQKTGQDWDRIQVQLSTAKPSLGTNRPVLTPVRIEGKKIEKNSIKTLTSSFDAESVSSGESQAFFGLMDDDVEGYAIDDQGTSVHFLIDTLADIPSDDRLHQVLIAQFNTPVSLDYRTVPKMMRAVYLHGKAKNVSQYPMMKGNVDIYLNSGFIGNSEIDFVAPESEFEISLGIENSLKVSRILDQKKTSTQRFSKSQQKIYAYDIEVVNYQNKPYEIQVFENIPITSLEEISVQILKTTTPYQEYDSDRGLIKWILQLKPQEKTKIHFAYQMTLPENFNWDA